MTESLIDPDTLTDPRDAAAYWFARQRSGSMGEAERHQFDAWRRAQPEHDREYRRAQGIWNATRLIPAERLRELIREPRPGATRHLQRRRLVLGLGVASAAAVVSGVVLPQWLDLPNYSEHFSTDHGSRRQVALPDGSVVDLNTDTDLTVRFYEDRRTVALTAGEAAFDVSHDSDCAFYVDAGDTTVRVTGTRFGVRRYGDTVRVAVESGSVEVKRGPWWEKNVIYLTAGQAVMVPVQGVLAPISHVNVAAMMAWRHGRVVFQGTPLAQAIDEINRYAPRAIQLVDGTLAQVRIAGVFSTDNTQAFLDLLPSIAPVRVSWRADGIPTVSRRK